MTQHQRQVAERLRREADRIGSTDDIQVRKELFNEAANLLDAQGQVTESIQAEIERLREEAREEGCTTAKCRDDGEPELALLASERALTLRSSADRLEASLSTLPVDERRGEAEELANERSEKPGTRGNDGLREALEMVRLYMGETPQPWTSPDIDRAIELALSDQEGEPPHE